MVTTIGASTAFFAASVGMVQTDIKRVIAYSTCSQLGYMFVAAGCSAYNAAMFHLFTHASFKALLFLGAGSVIHAMHHEQDMRHMGGLMKRIPLTWAAMLAGTIAITGLGIPFTSIGASGFYSKDAIIEAAYNTPGPAATYAFAMTVIAALMTSVYSWRLMFMTFNGRFKGEPHHLDQMRESPASMMVPLGVLALGALLAGAVFYGMFLGDTHLAFWKDTLDLGHVPEGEAPVWVKLAPFATSVLGLGIAYYYYILHPELPARMAARQGPLYLFLYNKWYFDEFYDFFLVRAAKRLGRFLWKVGDGTIIDGLGPDGIAARVQDATTGAVRLQSGYVYHYAFTMIVGLFALLSWWVR
jgi:NADH-quinone oxidoreductase subunit L